MELINLNDDAIMYICDKLSVHENARLAISCSRMYQFYPNLLEIHRLLMKPVLDSINAIKYYIEEINHVSHRWRDSIHISYTYCDDKLTIDFEDTEDKENCKLSNLFSTEHDDDMWYNEYCNQSCYDDCRRRFSGSVKITVSRDIMNSLIITYEWPDQSLDEFDAWALPKWADDWNADE